MSNRMDHDFPFLYQYFVDDPVVTDSKLEESGEIPFQGLRPDRVEILRQPLEPLCDSSTDGPIQPFEILDRRLQQAKAKHGLGQAEPPHYVIERFATFSCVHLPPLTQQPLPQ
jgi:hypothetical protein